MTEGKRSRGRQMLRRLLCLVGWHRPLPDVDPKWSMYWGCAVCGEVQEGELARNVRRWYR